MTRIDQIRLHNRQGPLHAALVGCSGSVDLGVPFVDSDSALAIYQPASTTVTALKRNLPSSC
ncbi:hypothetical protein NUV26_19645, partial [Burkholderia pseudomultivorans]|uniref:hypothetical protein n=1 Tax=Burkholderia pseudomultivorans TaxID=1207504 RepID=UPI002875452B